MFSLIAYKRYTEFWRDMWLLLLEPTSDIEPIPASHDQDSSQTQAPLKPSPPGTNSPR